MKTRHILWLLGGLLFLSSCGKDDSGDPDEPETKSYVRFTVGNQQVSAAGGTVQLNIETNLDLDDVVLSYIDQNKMIETGSSQSSGSAATRAATVQGTASIPVLKNENAHSRCSMFIASDSNDETVADTIIITQNGTDFYRSSDFSKDGEVTVLQTHTEGSGIPVILMGDGFGDREFTNGNYEKTMRQAMANLFSEQPMTALSGYFDVYMVNAVSTQNEVGLCYETVFSTSMPADGTTEIDGDDDAVQDYIEKAAAKYKALASDINDALTIVILNNNNYAGTTYFYSSSKGDPVNFSVAYCPVIESLTSASFRRVLVHEAVGHGFAKLADEYRYEDNATPSADDKAELDDAHTYGWFMNVSTSSTSTPWQAFADDSYYKGEPELTAAYEGGYTFWSGIWRPSENSMMNENDRPFNAPSRKEIYDKVLEHNGKDDSAFADFKVFDLANYPDFTAAEESAAQSRAVPQWQRRPLAKPVFRQLRRR